MSGRSPVSPELKILRGTRQNSRENAKQIDINTGTLVFPTVTEDKLQAFTLIGDLLAEAGLDAKEFSLHVYAAADCLAGMAQCERELISNGNRPVTPDGKKHPALSLKNELRKQLQSLLNDMGLSPAARNKVVGAKKDGKKVNEFAMMG